MPLSNEQLLLAARLSEAAGDMTWDRLLKEYEPGGQPAIYWFRCRHCSAELYYADYT